MTSIITPSNSSEWQPADTEEYVYHSREFGDSIPLSKAEFEAALAAEAADLSHATSTVADEVMIRLASKGSLDVDLTETGEADIDLSNSTDVDLSTEDDDDDRLARWNDEG